MKKVVGYMYILLCNDGTFYTGSTRDLKKRVNEHQQGKGENHTKKRLPVVLVYYEEFERIDWAFNREKQVQNWSQAKKSALIEGNLENLPFLAECQNLSHHLFKELRESGKIDPELEHNLLKLLDSRRPTKTGPSAAEDRK